MPVSLTETVALEMQGVEPWPNDAQLFQPYEVEQVLLPDNANCVATKAFLKICNLPFEVQMRWNAEWMSPSGRVPFLKCGKFIIPELEAIAQHCEKKGIKPSAQQSFSDDEMADMHAYISMINNVLYNAELYICWVHEKTYQEVTYARNGSVFAWPLSVFQNWSKRSKIIKQLKIFNWYQKTLAEVLEEVEKCCNALSERLGKKKYFFGNEPSELDALVFGHIFTIYTTRLPEDHLSKIVTSYDSLIKLAQRIDETYFKSKANIT